LPRALSGDRNLGPEEEYSPAAFARDHRLASPDVCEHLWPDLHSASLTGVVACLRESDSGSLARDTLVCRPRKRTERSNQLLPLIDEVCEPFFTGSHRSGRLGQLPVDLDPPAVYFGFPLRNLSFESLEFFEQFENLGLERSDRLLGDIYFTNSCCI